jgi:hypothetical protein
LLGPAKVEWQMLGEHISPDDGSKKAADWYIEEIKKSDEQIIADWYKPE